MSLRAPESFKDKLDTSDLRLVCREKRHRGPLYSPVWCVLYPHTYWLLMLVCVGRNCFFLLLFERWGKNLLAFLCCSPNQEEELLESLGCSRCELLLLIIARGFSLSLCLTIITDQCVVVKITWESQYLVLLLMLTWSPVFSGCPVEMFLSSAITKMPLPVSS